MRLFTAFTFAFLIFISCDSEIKTEAKQLNYRLNIKEVDLSLDSTHFRGLNMLSSNNVWITGTDGVFVHYDGESWVNSKIDSATGLDLRDVHVLSEFEVVTVSAGSPGKVFKTTDCGVNWTEVYSNMDSLIFFDGMDFDNSGKGVLFGDPMNGKIKLLFT